MHGAIIKRIIYDKIWTEKTLWIGEKYLLFILSGFPYSYFFLLLYSVWMKLEKKNF